MMNNCVQLLEKAENLKKELTLTRRNGLNGDGEATSNRAALQDLYRQILITNLEYALDKKIEQELWNFVFKNHITALQQQTKDKSNPKRTEVQNQLTIFLEASSGFYAMLLQDLCHAFKINLPCRVHPAKLALLKDSENIKRSSITQPERPSCQYMCQHCLVHLGDIARYRNQNGQAESYYRHAAQLVPSNGQPYNQLAILAAAGGDILSTAFYYCRSLAVKCPFPGSGTNLQRQLTKIIDGEEPRHQKISTSELIKFYLKFHACIYLRKYDTKLDGIVKRLLGYMHTHLRTGSLSKKQLIHMAFLNLFSLNHLSHGSSSGTELGGKSPVHNDSVANENGIDEEDGAPWNILVSFTVRMLGAFLACVPAYSDDTEDLEHPVLPATKLLLDWFCENDALLRNERISLYASVWQRLAKVLNALGNQDKANNMEFQPLPEDLEVRGFIGLRQSLSKLDFVGGYESVVSKEMQHPCRCYRLYQLGLVVARTSNGLLTTNEQSDGTVFACPLPDDGPSDTDEEEMAILEKMEPVHPPKVLESNKPPRMQKESGTTSILVSSDRSSSGKKDSKKATRVVKVNNDNSADSKLKSIQEEGSSQHDDHARSSTASSLDSTCSSPSNLDPPTHHKSSHHVTFAPMPSRHSASPEHVSNYSRRSPSPEFHQHSPDDDYPSPNYPPPSQDPRVMPHGPIHPLQQIGVYQQQQRNYPYPGQVPVPPAAHVRYPVRGITPHPGIPPPTALRGNHVHGPNPPPNPNELPKPLFPPQRMPFGPEGHMDDPANMYKTRVGEGSSASLARLAQLQQQQQMAHQAFVARTQVRPQIPTGLGLAARFTGQPGMRFPPNLQQMKVPPPQVDPIRNPDPHLEALWNQQRKAALQQQQQRNQMGPYRYPDTNLPPPPGPDNPNIQSMGMHNRNPTNPCQDLSGFPYGQVPRNIYPLGRGSGHASSPAGSNNTSSTSSPTPLSVGGIGPVASNTSPQAGSLPNQRGPSARYPEGFEGQSLNHPSLIHMIAAQQQKAGQQGFAKSPTQQKPASVFGQERPGDIFRNKSEAANVPPTRPNTILPSDIFGMSPNSGGMAGFGMSPANSSPSDQFPPYPLSQERQQIIEETLEMLENTVTNPSGIQQHQRAPEVSASDLLSTAERKQSEPHKQFAGLLGKNEDESYKLFPDTDPSWSLGRNSDNNNSLGLSNLGSIGSERAMAQQISNQIPPDRFLWGAGLTSQNKTAPQQRPEQQPGIQGGDNRFGGREYQAFWSSSMLPTGPSTLEQLLRQQQQHAGHDKTPP